MDGISVCSMSTALTMPVAADDPCVARTSMRKGDVQYLNFFAGTEPLLPMSYFEVVKPSGERGRFDPKAVDIAEAQVSPRHSLFWCGRGICA